MAKKYKSAKLGKQPMIVGQKPVSAFGKLANRLAESKKKKIQKLTETQKRVLQSKKNNKMIKVSKKAKKFALLDEDDPSGNGIAGLGLTHRGVNVRDLKEFDDVNLNESDLQNDEEFDNLQEKMNFAGFEATENLVQQQKLVQQNRPKTQNQIYKQIIQKSKAYKMVRQQQYESNLNKANELDEGFEDLVTQLKFRNKDQQLLERIEHRDSEYDKLMNQLRQDERVVSNKVIEKSEKVTQKIRKKKNQQLNKLMKDSDGEDQDIRGWLDGEALSQQDNVNNPYGDEENQQDDDNQYEEEVPQDDAQENSYDELDEVDLSSSEQEDQEEEGKNFQDDGEQQERDQEQQLGAQQQVDYSQQENDQQEQDSQDQDEDQDEQQQSQSPPKKYHKQAQKKKKSQPQTNKAPQNPKQKSKQNPHKKVKLNFLH